MLKNVPENKNYIQNNTKIYSYKIRDFKRENVIINFVG